jgi:hypothetical protein
MLWVKNDVNAWHIAKIRQHVQDLAKTAGRSGFEGGFVSSVIDAFTQLLRRVVRCRGGASTNHCEGVRASSPCGPGPIIDGRISPKPGSKEKEHKIKIAARARSDGAGVTVDLTLKPRGSRGGAAYKGLTGDASAGTSTWGRKDLALDSWSYYNIYRWVDDPEQSS